MTGYVYRGTQRDTAAEDAAYAADQEVNRRRAAASRLVAQRRKRAGDIWKCRQCGRGYRSNVHRITCLGRQL